MKTKKDNFLSEKNLCDPMKLASDDDWPYFAGTIEETVPAKHNRDIFSEFYVLGHKF